MPDGFTLLRPLIHRLSPEAAHHLGIFALRFGLLPKARAISHPSLKISAFGLDFPHPVGLAAGFDKNAVAVNALLAQGFGFVEAGTVTPLAQPGNPQPRMFRLEQDSAVINRLGFNNQGLDVFVKNFTRRRKNSGIAGANIGKNKDATDAIADYVQGLTAVYPHADYVTVNISSPNTQGLRALQQHEALNHLLSALMQVRTECAGIYGCTVPLLLKIAPDLTQREQEDIAQLALSHAIDGLIVGNTTISRPQTLQSPDQAQQGGLSGQPLFALSTEVLGNMYRLTKGRMPLVGVGGISSAADAYAKIKHGATLVQFYTALVYQGFSAVRDITEGLEDLLFKDGLDRIEQAIGVDVK